MHAGLVQLSWHGTLKAPLQSLHAQMPQACASLHAACTLAGSRRLVRLTFASCVNVFNAMKVPDPHPLLETAAACLRCVCVSWLQELTLSATFTFHTLTLPQFIATQVTLLVQPVLCTLCSWHTLCMVYVVLCVSLTPCMLLIHSHTLLCIYYILQHTRTT